MNHAVDRVFTIGEVIAMFEDFGTRIVLNDGHLISFEFEEEK